LVCCPPRPVQLGKTGTGGPIFPFGGPKFWGGRKNFSSPVPGRARAKLKGEETPKGPGKNWGCCPRIREKNFLGPGPEPGAPTPQTRFQGAPKGINPEDGGTLWGGPMGPKRVPFCVRDAQNVGEELSVRK